MLVTHLVSEGQIEKANQVVLCNQYGHENLHLRCSVAHCPDFEAQKANTRYRKLLTDHQKTLQLHPRASDYKFTGTIGDVHVDDVSEATVFLSNGMKNLMKEIRAYKSSYWQIEHSPSTMQDDYKTLFPHAHASVLIPAKGQPDADAVMDKWYRIVGPDAQSVEWKPIVGPPDAWFSYSTKAENLSGFTQAEFSRIISQPHHMRGRGYLN